MTRSGSRPDAPARLVLATRLARRDRLHGAWWPATTDIVRELPLLLAGALPKLQKVGGVTLNRAEWPDAPLTFKALPSRSPTLSWYGLTEPNLAVLHCHGQVRVALLVLPPATPEDVALAAMLLASSPGNELSTTATLGRARAQAAATMHGATADGGVA